MAKIPAQKTVETIKHDDAKRKNIPIAVKVINHLGDEVMKVFRVQ